MSDKQRTTPCFLAHSENDWGEVESLFTHLDAVSGTAMQFAGAFGAVNEAKLCGLFHDVGKMHPAFRRRLGGGKERVDHWSQGAWHALDLWGNDGAAAALCIQGHHQGLQILGREHLGSLHPGKRQEACEKEGITFGRVDEEAIRQWLAEHSLTLPESDKSVCPYSTIEANGSASSMLDVRMLYACLVDADFLETEAHFHSPAPGQRYSRPKSPELQPQRAWQCLQSYINSLRQGSQAAEHVRGMRDDLLAASCAAAESKPGLFTLTSPTGTGKTLAMLAFALRHAIENDLRRVVLVVPYLTIIEQTAAEYGRIFESEFGANYILEHHSLAGVRSDDRDNGEAVADEVDAAESARRMMAENWDAPVVITTSVQFFESLFAHRPAACRKLHRLADTVVVFDEAQTFPVKLALPTLATLSRLAERYRCTTVFSTATQPAFSHLDKQVRSFCNKGWQPVEIVPESLTLFERAKRVNVHWPKTGETTSWEQLAERLARSRQSLCIVNLKRHAIELVEQLNGRIDEESLFHLSTNMCPAHREEVLERVRARLKADLPSLLVSTQCVEAGVDIDFPQVYRAMAPLDAIAQAAGRCNRNGRQASGDVYVFIPEEEKYPGGGYARAAEETKKLLSCGPIDIDSPETFKDYFRGLYDLSDHEASELVGFVRELNFPKVAEAYKLIDGDAINVLVPYERATFKRLLAEIKDADRLTPEIIRDWTRRATPHAVSMYRPVDGTNAFWNHLEPIQFSRKREVENWEASWFEALEASEYERKTGLSQKYEKLWVA